MLSVSLGPRSATYVRSESMCDRTYGGSYPAATPAWQCKILRQMKHLWSTMTNAQEQRAMKNRFQRTFVGCMTVYPPWQHVLQKYSKMASVSSVLLHGCTQTPGTGPQLLIGEYRSCRDAMKRSDSTAVRKGRWSWGYAPPGAYSGVRGALPREDLRV